MPGIQSQRVILIEGNGDEIAPNSQLPAEMHGFVIMVPPGEEGEQLLVMLWRITMAYAAMSSMLVSRTTVRKMIEAVWSKESRVPKPSSRPARKSGKADRRKGDKLRSSRLSGKARHQNGESSKATASIPVTRKRHNTKTQK